MKALIVDEPWIGLILRGDKTWEMRKTGCSHRGEIALIRKGSGHVVGIARVTDSRPHLATIEAYAEAEPFHRIPVERQQKAFADGWRVPWVLADARPLPQPVAYRHPSGAVIWVNLLPDVVARIRSQVAGAPPDGLDGET
ncbi:ASCH domain-containing protein [Skermanella pratensis]|uniref:ASCH domain-containing protein n=1 Tax=Skermanella pratensis TaxID=2233999 RepID=UPI0013013E03|nr:ASCH domain-containing protein [Skermanella pratensis]